MDDEWYVVQDGKPTGPHAFEDLKNLNIRPGTFLKTAGMDDYKEAHEISELRALLGFKYRITAPQYFATLDVRLLAVALDYFLVTAVVSFIVFLVILVVDIRLLMMAIAVLGLILIPLVKLVYASIMECSPRQGTYGKIWIGIKVCDEAGARITASRSAARNLAKLLSVLTLGIGFLMGFFSKKQQCLHDMIAETLVVKDRLV